VRAAGLLVCLVTVSCAKESSEASESISGHVSIPSHGLSADIHWTTAVAFAANDRLLVFLTGASGASCEGIAEYLGPNTGVLSKEKILTGGSCSLMLALDEWSGSAELSWSAEHTEGYNPGISSVLRCELGEGAWVLETRAEEYEDYYWSGPVWAGPPIDFELSAREGADGVSVELDLRAFDGNFPYLADLERYPLDADLQGQMNASWCPALATATVL
jgi:hypothetical protein